MKHHLPVHIRPDGGVDNEIVNVSKSDTDEVVWHAEDHDFTIYFANSPFVDDTFQVPKDGSVSSGPVRPGVDPSDQVYQYDISSVSMAQSADPGIVIKP
jgi:hypothetical protein